MGKLDERAWEMSKQYMLVIHGERVFGPFSAQDAEYAEYAAMDFYGTAITGASARDAFEILELGASSELRTRAECWRSANDLGQGPPRLSSSLRR